MTAEKRRFWTFHSFTDFAANCVNYYCLRSYYNNFLLFQGLLKKENLKKKVFDDRWPAEKCDFWTFHSFADFAANQ